MRMRTAVLLAILVWSGHPVVGDTIFLVRGTEGSRELHAKDVVVTSPLSAALADKGTIQVRYYYWHARKAILVEESYYAKDGETISIDYSNDQARKTLISQMIARGVQAEIFDVRGRTSEVFCVRLDYRPPKGYMVVGRCPDDRTSVVLRMEKVVKQLDFDSLRSVEFVGGDQVEVLTADGAKLTGEWVRPSTCSRMTIKGLKQLGEPIEIELIDIARIFFRGNSTKP